MEGVINMRHKKLMTTLIFSIMLIGISATYAEDTETTGDSTISNTQTTKTFIVKGDPIGYTKDNGYSPIELTKKAKKQLKKIKKYNKKHKKSYKITLTATQYNKLINSKKQGKTDEIQVKTNYRIKIYKPIVKRCSKKIFSKKYYKANKYEKAYAKFDEKYGDDDDYKIIVDVHSKKSKDPNYGYITDYKKITIIKKYYKVKRYKAYKDKLVGSITVNNIQNDGKDWGYLFANKLGIDGAVAANHVKIS
jgi:hypothetical protein